MDFFGKSENMLQKGKFENIYFSFRQNFPVDLEIVSHKFWIVIKYCNINHLMTSIFSERGIGH